MKFKQGQEVWVKGVVSEEGDVDFRDGAGSFIEYLHRVVLNKLDIRTDEKVTIPKFVAEWIEYCKKNGLTLMGSFEPVSEHGIGLAETFKGSVLNCTFWASHNQEIFARAWLDGYEIEQEKLYTVEIPNPNQKGNKRFFIHKNPYTGEISLCKGNFNPEKNKNLWLTESEIKQDFDWARQFAKEVE